MTAIFLSVPVNKIDCCDTTFCCSYPVYNKMLEQSVALYGILSPLVVRKTKDSYRIISGFRRLCVVRNLNIASVGVLVSELDGLTAFRCAVTENLTHRQYNIFEVLIIIRKLATYFSVAHDDIIKDYLPLLGYHPHRRVLDNLLILCKLTQSQTERLYNGGVEKDKILLLSLVDMEAWDTFIDILINLKPGINKINQIIQLIREIAQREKSSVKTVVEHTSIQEILNDTTRTAPQRLNLLRSLLFRWRNPHLSSVEDEIKKRYNKLSLNKNMKLFLPPACEGDTFRIELSFRTKDELSRCAEIMTVFSQDKRTADLIDYIKDL